MPFDCSHALRTGADTKAAVKVDMRLLQMSHQSPCQLLPMEGDESEGMNAPTAWRRLVRLHQVRRGRTGAQHNVTSTTDIILDIVNHSSS